MSYFCRKPISSLVLKLFSDHHTLLKSPSHAEQKYALPFFKYCFFTEKKYFFQIRREKIGILPLNLEFLYQKSVIMQYNHHIRNQHQKLSRATYILLKIILVKISPYTPTAVFLRNFSCGPPHDGILMKIIF
jgi:hypothetical protein